MGEKTGEGQSGGVNFFGGVGHVEGNIAGRDMTKTVTVTAAEREAAFRPLDEAVRGAAPDQRAAAAEKLATLKAEVAKGEKADDGLIAKLLEGLVGLVPGAVSAVSSAFASPVLSGIAGPVTKYVLGKFQGE